MKCTYRIFSIKRPRRLYQTWLGGLGVYLKPAFNRGPAFINEVQFLSIFQIDLLLTELRDPGAVCQYGTIFPFVLPRKPVPRSPKVIIT